MTRIALLPLAISCGIAMLATTRPAMAADAGKEIATAATHAGMAAGSVDIRMVKTHLQHTINCLEGPGGADFDAGPGNPCKDQGMGALADATPDQRAALERALDLAKAAAAEPDGAKARVGASAAQAALEKLGWPPVTY
jgi:hypothetical protein